MSSFGTLLRVYRRQCRDPLRGGMLTQERLGELLGTALGHAGYSGAAVSDWERNKSKIDEDDRPVLVGLISVLVACQGLHTVGEANELLHAGNYRALDAMEQDAIFPHVRRQSPAAAAVPGAPPAASEAPEPTSDRRRQLILLQKVQRFWIEGVLQTSLAGSPPLELVWQRVPGAVQQPWEAVVHPALYGEPDSRTIADEFDQADRALLILGEAGAGKTTTLLRLASALSMRALADATAPVPVVLNLSSWATDRLPLVDWVAEELVAKYQIPRRIGRPWLEDDALTLLLDGFDELPAAHRPGCALALNAFRQQWGLTGLAVCTRPAEYKAARVRLQLGGAIRLQPLTVAQRDRYLAVGGERLASLRQAMDHSDALQELARTPLFLEVMSVVFRDAAPADVSGLAARVETEDSYVQETRERLFSAYEQRMFQLRGPQADYAPQQTVRWLAWLAAKMEEHDRTVFLLEELQPSWLSRRDRRLYLLAGHLITGLAGGLLMWLLLHWLRAVIPRFQSVLSPALAGWLGIPLGVTELLVLLGGSLTLALLMALIHLWQFERAPVHRGPAGEWFGRRRGILVGLLTGLLTIATMLLFGNLALALSWGLAMGFMFGMVSRYLTGLDYRHDIRPVEALGWSWFEAGKGLLVGLALAAAGEILETALFGYNGILRSVLFFGLAGFLVGGLYGRRIEEKSVLNQGILLSLRSAVAAALLAALALGALTWLMRTPRAAALTALLAAMIVFPLFGGVTVPKHLLVRLFLWREGHMPWRYGRFLEHAVQFGLLRQAGGGYTFMHRLLQDYYADRNQAASPLKPAT